MSSQPDPTDPSSISVLIVDDDPMVLSVLTEQLQPEGFRITTVNSPVKALEALQKENFSIILADQIMPGMTGLQMLAKVKESHPETTRVLVTGSLSLNELLDAVKEDVIHRFVNKPWFRDELLAILRNSVSRNLPGSSAASSAPNEPATPVSEAAESASGEASTAVAITTVETGDAAVEAFIQMLSAYHPNLGNTAIRARAVCQTLGEGLGLSAAQAQSLVWAGALHDISLVGVERAMVRRWLRSAEKCTEEELALVKRHPKESEEMLQPYPIFKEAGELIRFHHEGWDGSGYPDRIKGETIPPLARMLPPAIHFASRHLPLAQVLAEIQAQSDKLFNPAAVEAVVKAAPLTEMPRGQREIPLIELQPGMVLAKDISSSNGMVILAKGRELTTAWINKVLAINSSAPLYPLVLVYS
jgi:response regulator RpfG family c-di-GMP phosphodiesterase